MSIRAPSPIAGATALLAAVLAAPVTAGIVSPVASEDRPLGLDLWGPVQLAGSDDAAAAFSADVLPGMQETVESSLGESQRVTDTGSIRLDPNALVLDQESAVRVYFVGEGAGYHNSLGAFTGDPSAIVDGLAATDAKLVFPDATSSDSWLGNGGDGTRTESSPLLAGDFVDLGTLDGGTQLNFFLVANGANGGSNVYTADAELNPDGVDHFVSLAVRAVADSPFLLVGVEDLWGGGDADYNDLVFAVDIGAANVARLVAATVPLPPAVWAALAALGAVLWRRRRAAS